MRHFQEHRTFAIYLFLLSIFGMVLVYLVSFRFGPGLSTDGARYLATAQNLIEGNGFYDYLNQPLTQFPPLYSIFIAVIAWITRIDVFVAAQYLNILTFGLVIWLSGYFFYRIFPNEPRFHYFGSAVFATSLSLLIMASNVLSDLLFLAFTIAFLIAATDMLQKGTTGTIVLAGLIASLSTFQRYAGLALIMTGVVLLLYQYRKNIARGIVIAGLFGALTALPILLWVYFHNYLPTGILFGVRMPPVYLGNLKVTIEKAVHWFLPATVTNIIPLWAIVIIGVLMLVIGNRPADWKRWAGHLLTPYFLPSLVFFILYLCVLIFNISYFEVRWPYMDRIHIIILPSLLALLFLTIRELVPSCVRKLPARTPQMLSVVVFLLWLTFPVYNLQKYLSKAYYQGETSEYNLYNIPVLRDSGVEEFFRSQPVGADQKIYSNYEAAAWFLTRREITKLPFGDVTEKRVQPEEVLQRFPSWPGKDGSGYVIWIDELSFKPYVLSPEQLAERASFERVYWSRGAEIFLLTPK